MAAEAAILHGTIIVGGVGFDIHTMLYAAGATILGLQLVLFSILARTIGVMKNVLPIRPALRRFFQVFTLERGILLGLALGATGLALAIYSVVGWARTRLGALDPTEMMRVAIPSITLMLAGGEIVFASFLLGFIDLRTTPTGDT
jgi:hypothetical protein